MADYVTLKDHCKIRIGYLARSKIEPEVHGSHYLLQMRDFTDDRRTITLDSMIRISPTKVAPEACIQNGDVVFMSKGIRHFAAAAYDLPTPCLAASYFFILRPSPELLPAYLAQYINQPEAQQHFKRFGSSGAQPVVSRSTLESLRLRLPSLETQTMIIEIDSLAQREHSLRTELAQKKHLFSTMLCRSLAESNH